MASTNIFLKITSLSTGIIISICCLTLTIYSQKAGTLDTSFGDNGIVFCETNYGPTDNPIPIIDSKGRILTLSSLNNGSGFILVRCLLDGSFDPYFGDNGHVYFESDVNINCNQILVQQDDKILVAGNIQHTPDTSLYPINDFFITRFLDDGSLDISFGMEGSLSIGFGKDFYAHGLTLQEDGKIVVSGRTGTILWGGGNTDITLMRILPVGQPDSSFGIAGKVITDLTDSVWDIDEGGPMTIQPDGKIVVVAKNGTWYNDLGYFAIVRYQSNGLLDSSFATNGISIDTMSGVSVSGDIALTVNHFILVAGKEGDVFGGGVFLTLRQYTPEGLLDPDFAKGGIYKSDRNYNGRMLSVLNIQNDQKILATGWWGDNDGFNLLLMRFTPQGKLDSTFAFQGMAINQFDGMYCYGKNLILYPDGKITVTGTSINQIDGTSKVLIARYYNDLGTAIPNVPDAKQLSVQVYPNPASDFLTIACTEMNNNVVVTITDISGKIHYKKTASQIQTFEVNTNDFTAGLYMVQIQIDGIILTKKIVISK